MDNNEGREEARDFFRETVENGGSGFFFFFFPGQFPDRVLLPMQAGKVL
jgi:hypothetical protein